MAETGQSQPLADQALVNIRGASVLVAEDSKINQQIAEELLGDIRLQVTIVNNGQEALEALSNQEFDLVLMDIQMPVMDGFEATKIIRANPKYKDLPVIAMTADSKDDDRQRCLAAGLNDHVVKSLNPEPLYQVLVKWLNVEKSPSIPSITNPVAFDEEIFLPTDLPGIDCSIGLKIVRGNTRFLQKLLLDFYEEHHDDMQLLYQAIKSDNDTLARRIVHTLISTAGSIGAIDLHAEAMQADEVMKQNQRKVMISDISRLEQTFIPVMNGLREYSKKVQQQHTPDDLSADSEKEIDVEAVFAVIDELAALISGFSPDSERKARELQRLLHYFYIVAPENHLSY